MKYLLKRFAFCAGVLSLLLVTPAPTKAQLSQVKTVWVILMENHNWTANNAGAVGRFVYRHHGHRQAVWVVEDPFNQTGGVDTRLVFFKDWFVDAHLAGTRSPGDPSGNSDVGASLS